MAAVAKALGVEKKKVGFNDPAQWDWRLPESASSRGSQNSGPSTAEPTNPHAEKDFTEDEEFRENPIGPEFDDEAEDREIHENPEGPEFHDHTEDAEINSGTSTNPLGENDFAEDPELPPDQNSGSSINPFSPNAFNHSGEAETPEDPELRGPLGKGRPNSALDPSANGIPSQITNSMKMCLRRLKRTDAQIEHMTPREAWEMLRAALHHRGYADDEIPEMPPEQIREAIFAETFGGPDPDEDEGPQD